MGDAGVSDPTTRLFQLTKDRDYDDEEEEIDEDEDETFTDPTDEMARVCHCLLLGIRHTAKPVSASDKVKAS